MPGLRKLRALAIRAPTPVPEGVLPPRGPPKAQTGLPLTQRLNCSRALGHLGGPREDSVKAQTYGPECLLRASIGSTPIKSYPPLPPHHRPRCSAFAPGTYWLCGHRSLRKMWSGAGDSRPFPTPVSRARCRKARAPGLERSRFSIAQFPLFQPSRSTFSLQLYQGHGPFWRYP